MGSYKLTWHGGGGVCSACGELQAPGHGVGGVCVELRSDVARRGRCLLKAGVARRGRCGRCLCGVTS